LRVRESMIERCVSCGAPLHKRGADLIAPEPAAGRCGACVNPDGSPKPKDEIVRQMASFLVEALDLAPDAALEIADERVSAQPGWRRGTVKRQ
jgi:hypothetical protein